VALLGGDGTFRWWSLEGGPQVTGDVTLKGIGPQPLPLSFCFLAHEVSSHPPAFAA
jgi:hypothetical protein